MSAKKTIKDPKDVVCLFIDNGLFTHIAKRLAQVYKKVYIYTNSISAFPKMNLTHVGYGVEGLTVVDSIFGPHFDEIDLFCFPDIYSGDLQVHLEGLGKNVWGCRMGEALELKREGMKEILEAIDMPVGKFTHVVGLANLRALLRERENVFVKIDRHRGTFETFRSANYRETEPKLDELEYSLGPFKHIIEFTVEDEIPDCIELGTDGWCITSDEGEAQYTKNLISGIEIKDVGFLSKFTQFDKLPKELTTFNDRIKPVLGCYNWRGFFSTEVRITSKKECYMIDFCSRAPSPPSELYASQYRNLAECIYFGALGIVVEPEPEAKIGVELMLHSSWADKSFQPIDFPPEIADFVKIRNWCVINGINYAIPQAVGLPECGAVIGLGDTIEEAMDHAVENAEQVTGYYLEAKTGAIDDIKKQLDIMDERGLNYFK
jgi:hypothetical protein